MRKYIKTIFENAIDGLIEINKKIEAQLYDVNSELLMNAQQMAIEIGSGIERLEAKGTAVVNVLETYCELLWQLSQESEPEGQGILLTGLKSTLETAKNEIIRLPEQYEIIFLPYKASMWDCMESVWMAAKEDPDCTVKVIPIPYYDRNSDGSLAQMHYEGGEMPEYVEITHYNDYSIEESHPDIVYIHNPYDAGNYVTCVHPQYFSPELKKYTDMLVYIPYFMSGAGAYPEIHWNLPAYQYVDKIILQDEGKREGLCRFVPEEKLVVAGNPKVDRVLRLEEEHQRLIEELLPQGWREKIQGKRVFLYNVSLSGILQNSDTAIDKIRNILSIFARRDDVVLLWRPHPLIESTLKTLRPGLYQQYMELKQAFVEADKGIFDDTADAGVSVAVSDAYIGEDSSSMIHYFGVSGKNMLYTNWKVNQEKTMHERRAMPVISWFEENGKIYFVPDIRGMEHMLYALDLNTGEIIREEIMQGKALCSTAHGAYGGITKVRGKIVLVPHYSNEIYVYDKEVKQAIKVLLLREGAAPNFNKAFVCGEKVFFQPKGYPAIAELDIRTNILTEYPAGVEMLTRDGKVPCFAWACGVKDNQLYSAMVTESRVHIFNMEDGSYKIRDIGEYEKGYCSMVYDGSYFWLSTWGKARIVRWDEETGETVEIAVCPQYPERESVSGVSLIDAGNLLYGFNTVENAIWRVEKDNFNVTKIHVPDNGDKAIPKDEEGYIYAGKYDDTHAIAFRKSDNSFVLWDISTETARIYPAEMSMEEMLDREHGELESLKKQGHIPRALLEHRVSITQYIDYVVHRAEKKENDATEVFYRTLIYGQAGSGERIHRLVKNSVATGGTQDEG